MDAAFRKTLERMFSPRSVALIGSTSPMKFGGLFLKALLDIGYDGEIYPVNPNVNETMGLKVYPDVKSIDKPIDLACIGVPRESAPEALRQCLECGVPGAEILTSGFGEAGDELGAELEREIASIARDGLRILGPNCFGVHSPECGLTILPGNEFDRVVGPVAFISQSGGVCADLGHMASGWGLGFTQMVSFGNACDIDAVDLIEYFAGDSKTRIITGYIEGVRDGRRFFDAAAAAAREKPVVLWKAGLSETGSRAVVGHTGSMAGDRALWEGMARQANVTLVGDLPELLDVTMAFSLMPELAGDRLAVIGGGGAISVFAADMADEYGLVIPPFSKEVRADLEKVLPPPGNNLANPCDVGNPMIPPELLGKLLERAARIDEIDAQVVIQIPYHIVMATTRMGMDKESVFSRLDHHKGILEQMGAAVQDSGKPMLMVLRNIAQGADQLEMEDVWRRSRDLALEAGFPVYPDIRRAFRALGRVVRYYSRRADQ